MSKIISYSLFKVKNVKRENEFEFFFYFRGIVFNSIVNSLVYPNYTTHIELDAETFSAYDNIFYGLKESYGITFNVNEQQPLCRSMLWRLKKIFDEDAEIVLCRDADALTSYREAQAVQEWEGMDKLILSIQDSNSHTLPLMGGLVGFKAKQFREKYGSWDDLLSLWKNDDWSHGQDQKFMMNIIYPEFKNEIFKKDMRSIDKYYHSNLQGVDSKLWESNLCCAHIGSAGAIDMEVIRFTRRFGAIKAEFEQILKRYKTIFYWL